MYSRIGDVAAASGFGPLRVGLRRRPLAVGDVELLVGRVVADRGRIPAGRDEAERLAPCPVGDVEDGDVVGVGVGDEQHLAVRRQARLFGVLPGRGRGVEGAGRSSAVRLPVRGSRTLTLVELRRRRKGRCRRAAGPFRSGCALRSARRRRPCFSTRINDGEAALFHRRDEQPPAAGSGSRHRGNIGPSGRGVSPGSFLRGRRAGLVRRQVFPAGPGPTIAFAPGRRGD